MFENIDGKVEVEYYVLSSMLLSDGAWFCVVSVKNVRLLCDYDSIAVSPCNATEFFSISGYVSVVDNIKYISREK